jgi:nicotinate-nucleotide--dimethylbenzimidazole phosphoribosyltransferase
MLQRMIEGIAPLDTEAMRLATIRQSTLTKPEGSLGRLEAVSIHVAGIRASARPVIREKAIFVMTADHGVVEEGVSHYPQSVTAQMVLNFLRGGAAVNVLSRHVGARVIVVDLGVAEDLPAQSGLEVRKIALGTNNMARGPAMDAGHAMRSLEAGFKVVERELARGVDLIGLGEMGIGNTTASSAVTSAIIGTPAADVTGRGTGLDDAGLQHKTEIIERALQCNKPDKDDPLDVLTKVGGYEIGAMAGAILAAAKGHVPVVLDGFITGAAALIAVGLAPQARDYLIAAHRSVEIGHAHVLDYLGLEPLLDLNLRLGEGTGAALGISLVEASTKILNEMATFTEVGISKAEE